MRNVTLKALLGLTIIMVAVLLGPATLGGQAGPPFEDGSVLVGFQPGVTDAEAEAIVRGQGATQARAFATGAHELRVPPGRVQATIAQLKNNPRVRYAEPNYIVEAVVDPNDTSYGQLWGLKNTGQSVNGTSGTADADIDADQAWAVTTGSASIVVGVVDTGIDYNHPDLAANVWSNSGGVGGCVAGTHGYDAYNGDCNPLDDHNHGSHVSGTIGAKGNNAAGVAGVNWTTSLMGLKFLGANGSGSTAGAIAVIDFAIQAKQAGVNIRVLNNSWGGGGFSQALLDAINDAGAHGILFAAAAGNSNVNVDSSLFYPCAYNAANIICVAATTQTDARASFSNYGATKVHLGAPGTNIYSTIRNNGYAYYNGTSMATPHVAGAAALILASEPGLTVADLKARILSTVDPKASMAGVTVTGGRLNVCNAIPACVAAQPPLVPTGLTAADHPADTGGVIDVAWTPSSSAGVTEQRLYRSTTNGSGYALIATFANNTTNAYPDTGLSNGTTYYYVVRAFKGSESGNSNQASATPIDNTAPQPPAAPSNLVASAVSRTQINLTWTDNANNEEGFVVERRREGEATFTPIATINVPNTTSYQDTGLQRRTRYYYRIRAFNAAGDSAYSNEANARTRP